MDGVWLSRLLRPRADRHAPVRAPDFSIGYQIREQIGPLAFDLAAAVQASSDFDGEMRGKGIQYPGHGVGLPHRQAGTRPGFRRRRSLPRGHQAPSGGRADLQTNPETRFEWFSRGLGRFFNEPNLPPLFLRRTRRRHLGDLAPTLGNDLATYRDLRACRNPSPLTRTVGSGRSRPAT